ncbi:hypothetical protein [Streptomyces sp. NPDC085466]|uniref:hypothetical protein n=1 Tax=Streptomyces sp. NPDC085466 TaxID=3365725 RepID=UPI0037D563D4
MALVASVVVAVVVVVVLAVPVILWLLRRVPRDAVRAPERPTCSVDVAEVDVPEADVRPGFPPEGLLVPEDVLRSGGPTSAAIWDALEAAATPVAVAYHPVGDPRGGTVQPQAHVRPFAQGGEEVVAGLSRVGVLEPVVQPLLGTRLRRSRFGLPAAVRACPPFRWCEEMPIARELLPRNAAERPTPGHRVLDAGNVVPLGSAEDGRLPCGRDGPSIISVMSHAGEHATAIHPGQH